MKHERFINEKYKCHNCFSTFTEPKFVDNKEIVCPECSDDDIERLGQWKLDYTIW